MHPHLLPSFSSSFEKKKHFILHVTLEKHVYIYKTIKKKTKTKKDTMVAKYHSMKYTAFNISEGINIL